MRLLGKRRFRLFREQRGFSLIEVLVAVGILGLIGTGVVAALDTNSRAARTLDEQVVAANLATDRLEAIKELPYADTYPNAGDGITLPPEYSVDIDIDYSNDGITWVDNYNGETLQKITVAVSRQGGYVLSICTYRCEK